MPASNPYAYLFLDLAFLFGMLLICLPFLTKLRLRRSRLALAILGLFALWCCVDWLAVGIGIWSFPVGRTLSFRLLGLPLEEYAVFVIHSLVCLFLIATSEERA